MVEKIIKTSILSLKQLSCNSEIAFFGGSFTAINEEYMISLLKVAYPYIKNKTFSGIRISTRPDAIDKHILDVLKRFKVTAIELGAQSMDDTVLSLNNRGHDASSVITSSKLIKEYGFSLGLQMMVGLYGSSIKTDLYTADCIAKLQPDTIRIYPTTVLKGTRLHELMNNCEYVPMEFENAIDLCARLLNFFESKNIKVIRCGLHDSESLRQNMVGGIFHPAFRELCESKIFLDNLKFEFNNQKINKGKIIVYINPKDLSKAIGQNKCNIQSLRNFGYDVTFKANMQINPKKFLIRGI